MIISIELNEEDSRYAQKCAERHNLDLAEVAREALLERLDDAEDLRLAEEALEEYRKNPVTYTQEEMGRMLGLL